MLLRQGMIVDNRAGILELAYEGVRIQHRMRLGASAMQAWLPAQDDVQNAIRTSVSRRGARRNTRVFAAASGRSTACPACSQMSVSLQAWLPARTYVREAIETRQEVDGSGEIIKLSRYCPWKEHLYELEQELSVDPPIKFCLYEVHLSSSHAPKRLRRLHVYMRSQQALLVSQDTITECYISCSRSRPAFWCS